MRPWRVSRGGSATLGLYSESIAGWEVGSEAAGDCHQAVGKALGRKFNYGALQPSGLGALYTREGLDHVAEATKRWQR